MSEFAVAAERARVLVREGVRLAAAMQGKVDVRDKGGRLGPVTEADLAVERLILDGLEGAPVLAEETCQTVELPTSRLWCADPIDGTREYVEGRTEWAVQIGLLVDGEPVAGACGLGDGTVYWGWRDGGAFVDRGRGPIPVALPSWSDLVTATVVHTRRKLSDRMTVALDRLGCAHRIAAGGCGYKAMLLLSGEAQVYLHNGRGTTWWDTVGPAAVFRAAGGSVTRPDGSPLRFADDVAHPAGFLFTTPGLVPACVAALR